MAQQEEKQQEYNFRYNIQERPAIPFAAFPIADNPPKTRHHIIDGFVFFQYWNACVESGNYAVLLPIVQQIKKTLKSNIAITNKSNNAVHVSDEIIDTTLAYCNKQGVVHNPNNGMPNGLEDIMQIIFWMSGNLFVGPMTNLRTDDPGNNFEVNCKHITGISANKYNQLKRIYDALVGFTNKNMQERQEISKKPQQQKIYIKLSDDLVKYCLPQQCEPIPFKVNDWETNNKGDKWKIKT
eukprot:188290_1